MENQQPGNVEESNLTTDRLTQLQEQIDNLTATFWECLSLLNESTQKDAAQLAVEKVKVAIGRVEILIENLPGINDSEEKQLQELESLEQELQEANKEYLEAIAEAENLMKQIRDVIHTIFEDQVSLDDPAD
ncbi:hypothetical protein G9A89_007220 [Geosiphon pyriformis]|nr:hypothetical protein G9A89_007220 [Geosiphon pyriformis]